MGSDATLQIPIPRPIKERIARLAAARHVQMATLVKPWLVQRLEAEEAKEPDQG